MKDRYYLLSESEISLIVLEMREVLEDLENIIKNKKLKLNDSKNCSINFDSEFLNEGI